MVMKVHSINNVVFGQVYSVPAPKSVISEHKEQINKLGYVTPDFEVNIPAGYKKISVNKLDNGLELHNYKLTNGYKVTIVPMKGSPAVVKSYVNVGSLNETSDIKGISHFLEHMAFNGTNGENGHLELKQGDSFKKIDKLGGWANASTNYAITDYVNSAPLLEDKDLETQIQVISSMAEDLKLSEDMIAKEKGPVSSEINMILDNPQTIAMDQTVRSLFNIQNPADELVGGSVSHIQNLTRDDILNYYNKYYTPDNTKIVITGDVNPEEAIKLVSKNFVSRKTSKGQKFEEKLTPIKKTVRKDFESDKTTSAEIVIGFAGPKNSDTRGKILLELASTYMNSHEAGLIPKLKKYNSYPIINSEKITTNPNGERLVFMEISPGDYNVENVLKTIFNTLGNNKQISKETTDRLKQRLKQENESFLEQSVSVNDFIGHSLLDNDLEYVTKYNQILDSITPEELTSAVKEYFDISKSAITVVHPAKNPNSGVSFKGNSNKRQPIDTSLISEYKLKNNYDIGFYKTNNNNISLSLKLLNTIPYTKKAGVAEVLNEICTMGIKTMPVDKFNEFREKNNLSINANANQYGIAIEISGDTNNYKLGMEKAKELLYTPNINEENIKTAVNRIKDRMARQQVTAHSLQKEIDSFINPFQFRKDEILKGLDKVTVDDVEELHRYILKNSRGIVCANIPEKSEKEVKYNILKNINSLKEVEPNNYKPLEIHKEVKKPIVITSKNHNSQADISEVFRFERDNTIKEKAVIPIMNSILSSSSIGLFDVLREKENLAYSVFSDYSSYGNQGQLSLNILTTTDNKDIGEYSYDNVQKSINGFNRQIKELLDGKFKEEDLEIAKRSMKAGLLNNEGNYAKLHALEGGLNSNYGIDLKNKIYTEIDKITKEDVISYAQKIFSNKPVYTITASKNTLDANKEFLDGLKNRE